MPTSSDDDARECANRRSTGHRADDVSCRACGHDHAPGTTCATCGHHRERRERALDASPASASRRAGRRGDPIIEVIDKFLCLGAFEHTCREEVLLACGIRTVVNVRIRETRVRCDAMCARAMSSVCGRWERDGRRRGRRARGYARGPLALDGREGERGDGHVSARECANARMWSIVSCFTPDVIASERRERERRERERETDGDARFRSSTRRRRCRAVRRAVAVET